MAKRKKPAARAKKPATKRNTKASKTKKSPDSFKSHYKEWILKKEILDHFQFSERTLQNLRSNNVIVWSKLGGNIYYHMPSIAARLDENRRG